MENIYNENEELRPEVDPAPSPVSEEPAFTPPAEPQWVPPVSQPIQNREPVRKESPFADSPYVINRAPSDSGTTAGSTYVPPIPPQAPPKPPKARKRAGKKFWKGLLAAVLALAVIGGSCSVTALLVNNHWEDRTAQLESTFNDQIESLRSEISSASQNGQGYPQYITVDADSATAPGMVYAQNVHSVVLVNSTVSGSVYGQTTTGVSSGSGFILTADGYVVTNCHVVENASSVSVTLYDGSQYSAQIVGTDSTNDVAVLKMDGTGFDPVTLGSSTDLAVGDQVVAIGNPLGELTSTLTVGYVSAKDRDVTTEGTLINMIQTDAAINSGNSGGPLFNMKGEVVGITTAKYSGSSSSGATIEGIGFAIPMDDVSGIIQDLIDYGYVTGAYLGVMVSDVDASTASYYNMPVGAYVSEVTPGYAAEKAGLKVKDIIVGLGDYEIGGLTDLTRALRNFKAGETTTITVYRSGQQLTLTITLDEKPRTTDTTTGSGTMPEEGSYEDWYNYFAPFFGNGNGG